MRDGKFMSKRVLVVDDDPNIVLSLVFLMKGAGYEVDTAANGNQALKAVDENAPDLILLDINLPERNGFEVCQTLREDPQYQDIRILMLTAKWRDVDKEKGLALGADDYITKPFSTREVSAKVAELLSE